MVNLNHQRHLLKLKDKDFNKEVLESDKVVLIDFWAPLCAPCRMMEPVIEQLAAEYDGKAKVGKVNVDEETAKNLTQGFAVGMGGSTEATCGAIIGAVNVLGMINKDASKTMQGSRRIINRFKEQNGTVICKELKGLTDGVIKRECIDCVKYAASFLEDELK